jgi:sRNA-binding protein
MSETTNGGLINELIQILGVSFRTLPYVFRAPHPKVLKVGIDQDLILAFPKASPDAIRGWLARWTTTYAYLRRTARGKNRHDLNGQHVGYISWKSRKHAMRELDRIFGDKAVLKEAVLSEATAAAPERAPGPSVV